ncbi:MAG: Fructuronate reductase, partial [Solirubrobacterales bacterium]|nr:Fructuronate reductase [Solirubrobacterales bacterium]
MHDLNHAPADGTHPLCDDTVDRVDRADPRVEIPAYDRNALTAGVVHIGVGAFHRAHQQIYFDALARTGETAWGVIGVGLHSRSPMDALEPQDTLYTVVERGADEDTVRIVGTLSEVLHGPEDPEAVIRAMADEHIRLVTLTVTGGGYHVDLETHALLEDAEDIRHDLGDPHHPETFLPYVVEALARRRANGVAPFTVLSCDNVPANGAVARAAVTSFARLKDEGLADWIAEHVAFPSSMVDRITPETTEESAAWVGEEFGIHDQWPVITEPFRQWVIEDRFCNERPPLDRVGVQFVADTGPYELVKKRLLNGSHCALGYLGSLAGHRTTNDAMSDPAISGYLRRLMDAEIGPLLPEVDGVDLERYKATLIERFANPNVADELQRLAGRGSTKMPSYLLPTLHEAIDRGTPHALLDLAVAGWLRYLCGTDCDGNELTIKDARLQELESLLRQDWPDPRPLLAERSIFGGLGEDEAFASRIETLVRALDERGVHAVLAEAEAE